MKCFTLHLALLWLLYTTNSNAQTPHIRSFNTTTGELNDSKKMPTNAIADDFGPRDRNDDWHGGVDFNASKNDGNDDLWHLMISPQAGKFADFDHMTHGIDKYKYALVNVKNMDQTGSHTLLFGHVFDWMHRDYNLFNGKIVLKRCEHPRTDKWGLYLNFTDAAGNAVTHCYGQVAGATLDINGAAAGGNFTTSNGVNTTDVFMPIGRSGGSPNPNPNGDPLLYRFSAHLHLNTLPYNTAISNDAINGDPCQFLNIDRPDYDIAMTSQFNTSGITIKYPGTEATKIKARVQMRDEALGVNRYNHLMDVDKVELKLKKSSENNFSRIKGDQMTSIISEGGRLGEAVINHANPINKENWLSNGINSNAYNATTSGANARNPWDDYYFIDFKTLIHKDDQLTSGSKMAFVPSAARYTDGSYKIQSVVSNAQNQTQVSPESSFTLDNF